MARYLIADPDYSNRKAMALLLTYRLQAKEIFDAVDGIELQDRWRQLPLDLILVDWALPGLPAPIVFLDFLREHPKTALVLLSVDSRVSGQAQAYGATFISKALPAEVVIERLQAVLAALHTA